MEKNILKKVFISVPMRNRKWSNILKSIDKMTAIAKEMFGEDCLIISSTIKEKPNEDVKETSTGLWYLGESLKILSQADCFIGFTYSKMRELGYNGCAIETCCAQDYKLEIFYCDLTKICEDLEHVEVI